VGQVGRPELVDVEGETFVSRFSDEMSNGEPMDIKKEVMDELLKGYQKPDDIFRRKRTVRQGCAGANHESELTRDLGMRSTIRQGTRAGTREMERE
jgi:hypothetical protein